MAIAKAAAEALREKLRGGVKYVPAGEARGHSGADLLEPSSAAAARPTTPADRSRSNLPKVRANESRMPEL